MIPGVVEDSRRATKRIGRLRGWMYRPGARSLAVGGSLVLLMVLLVTIGPTLSPHDPIEPTLTSSLQPPGGDHPLGTDELGRDILARVLSGGRRSVGIGIGAGFLALAIGAPVGLLAGYFARFTDVALMRLMDLFLAIPAIVIALTIVAAIGRGGIGPLVAIVIVSVPAFARLARAEALRLKEREFVVVIRLTGGSHLRALRAILRNGMAPLAVQLVVTVVFAVILEASLSFLGMGPPPPDPSWGQMLRSSQQFLFESPMYAVAPGVCLTLLTLGADIVGRGLRMIFADRIGSTDVSTG